MHQVVLESHFIVLERATHVKSKVLSGYCNSVLLTWVLYKGLTLSKTVHHSQILDMLKIVIVMSLSAVKYITRHNFFFAFFFF